MGLGQPEYYHEKEKIRSVTEAFGTRVVVVLRLEIAAYDSVPWRSSLRPDSTLGRLRVSHPHLSPISPGESHSPASTPLPLYFINFSK